MCCFKKKMGVLMVFAVLSLPMFGQNSQTTNLSMGEPAQTPQIENQSNDRISGIRKDMFSNSNREGGCGSQVPVDFREQAVMNNPKVLEKDLENDLENSPKSSPK